MRRQGGFTIVELMIVLAVTGIIFFGAITLISGRTSQTEFMTAIQNVQGQVQQVINEVGNGYYPNNGNFKCVGSPGSFNINPGANEQGANTGCIFLGKIMQFNTNSTQFTIYTVAGAQLNVSSQEVQTYSSARPLVIAQGSTAPPPGSDLTGFAGTPAALQYGVSVSSMYYCATTTVANCSLTVNDGSIGAVAILSSLGAYSGSALQANSQHFNLVPIYNSSLTLTPGNAVDKMNIALDTPAGSGIITSADDFVYGPNPANTVLICFSSGTTNQSGLVTIGGRGNGNLSVTLSIRSNKTCT